jgi:putative acetyltransferase
VGTQAAVAAYSASSKEVRVLVRPETDRDLDGIREVNIVAFQGHPYSQQTEHLIVEALRAADALEVSLVAESDGEVVGHIAFSAAAIGGSSTGWFLLGPVAVRPSRQGEGIGRALVEAGLAALRTRGAGGCVLVGDPAFYVRFGFRQYPSVAWHGVPDENVLCLPMSAKMPTGEVAFHPAFLAGT